jgi:transposase-like protein
MEAIYTDDEAAREHLEKMLWPHGPVCPKCQSRDAVLMKGKSHRLGLYNCRPCDKPFTVTVGTVFESSHIPLHKWVYATHLLTASKKGISALQLQRMLSLGSYRTAWFMAMRIREALKGDASDGPLGGEGKIVEADETYFGKVENPTDLNALGKPLKKKGERYGGRGPANKRSVVALVERGGKARVFHVGNANRETVARLLLSNVAPATRLHTDESRLYKGADAAFASHETVKHAAKEFARGDVNTNSAEGFFGVFKRGMRGVYQHCGEKYLQRYVTEFEFRYNNRIKLGVNDKQRATLALQGAAGKRLTLRRPKGDEAAA